ncbi:mitochondrial genome maintenance exonuclease 1-like isoform X2 [Daphnia carinata]|uniref:mitochondrial genome maintenance exonuclease 1-like isoform X2 n=1 Tax=Daphnia carinata TaxID=120202 RepID=UPI0028685F83|nr:mitochondrial genome maintenance exonuclease 1-like isoform X2 [Daphnia carinata]
MHGVRTATVIFRSNIIRLRILNGEKSIFTSTTFRKDEDIPEKLYKVVDKKAHKRKLQLLKWNKTNLALFGPIIKEDKKKLKENNSPVGKKEKTAIEADDSLLPISLWNESSVELKLSKTGFPNNTVKIAHKNLALEATKPITTVLRESSSKVQTKQHPTHESVNFQSIKLAENILPSAPYFQKDDIILPFPMVLKKEFIPPTSKDIITIASAKVDVPSVTQVLNKTMSDKSEMMLALWRKRKIAEVGEEGLKEFMREAKLVGKELHTSIETYLRGVEYSSIRVEPRISGHWLSMKSILNSLEDVLVLESYVVHQQLKYKGFVDCVCKYKDNVVVVEWKTSQRTKSTLEDAYDDPVQIAAYIGALNADEKYPFKVENALLVIAYPTGRPADVLTLDRDKCEYYWDQWLKRLEAYNELKRSDEKA